MIMRPDPKSIYADAMRTACAEARRWLGATSPNPPVGAVALNAAGMIIAQAAHHRAGALHAEALLLAEATKNNLLQDIDILCVTLEPCNHQGRTPPCTEAIIKAGIKRVAIGARDPNPLVQGGGVERLREAGIDVISGVAEDECRALIHAFAYHAKTGKAWVTVKRAFDTSQSMIPPVGHKTFTNPDSLRLAHRLRKKADAIITGSGTILADSPLFTVRYVADFLDKKRWLGILDRRRRVSDDYLAAVTSRGLMPIIYDDINHAMDDLSEKGAQDILAEAGPALSASILAAGIWNMQVDVIQGTPDSVITRFKPPDLNYDLEWMLPCT